MFRNYFKTALRNLLRHRIFALINVVGLSLGLAATMLIILFVKDELSFDRFHANLNQLYRVDRKIIRPDGSQDFSGYSGYFPGPRFAAQIPEIRSFIRLQPSQVDIRKGTDIRSQFVWLADSSFFTSFSFPLLQGNARSVLREPHTVVITEDVAKREFGKADAMGKTLMIREDQGFAPYTVSGIARNPPENSSIHFDLLLPLHMSPQDETNNENWFQFFLSTYILLQPGADLKTVEAKMQKVFLADAGPTIRMIQEKYKLKNLGMSFFLQPLGDLHLSPISADDALTWQASSPLNSYILSGIALFILLIACINFVNLTVARSVKRAKEIGIRKVVGGERKQLIAQFLGESMLLCLAAFVLALVITQITLPLFNRLSNKALALAYLFDGKLLVAYVALFLLTGLLAGFYPALVLSKFNPVKILYGRFALGSRNGLQKSLVVLQFACASFLIVSSITMAAQFRFLTEQKLGYDDANLVTVEKMGLSHQEAAGFKHALLENPDILQAAVKNSGTSGTTVLVNGNQQVNITKETVDAQFLPLLQVPIVEGRNFSPQFPSDSTRSVLVNETFAREAGWADPIGQIVDNIEDKEKYSVVGVVKDYHYQSLTSRIEPQLFTMRPANDYGAIYIKIRPGRETAALDAIHQTFRAFFPLNAFAYQFKDQENALNYASEARWKEIILFGALLTIFISCIGLFGLAVLSAEKRTKEIAVRKVLGATVSNITAILSRNFLFLVYIALVVSLPLAWLACHKWLENYPYRIALGAWIFLASGMLVLLVAAATVSFQAIKASLANPAKSLRNE